ncbi:MAG: type III pantothenate kinase [Deltaproteobacteria bacterium]|nr:type III pantothenate kinase [Deltaproteobacteria bacterium]
MLMVVDVGNTNIVLGLFDEDRLIQSWRLTTDKSRTSDEYGILIHELYARERVPQGQVTACMVSCVVPPMIPTVNEVARKFFKLEPQFVGPGIRTGMAILYDSPREVGADRIVNAVAAFEKLKRSCIVVDFGTATTFDVVSSKGEYLGGAIAPGLGISTEALFQHASKLPRVELVRPRSAIGKTTVHSMQAGLIFGYAGLVDALVRRIIAELGGDKPAVIATGGIAPLVASETETIEEVDELLTLTGLRILHDRNK